MACYIDYLPDEILEYILNLIPPYKDLKECMLVCKRWQYAVKHVIEHRDAYFRKSINYGQLSWNYFKNESKVIIGKRHSHCACIYENSMFIFGGCTKTGTTFNDLWKFDLDTRKWERPIPMGSYPSPKACASMVYYKKSFILFGGWAHPSTYPPFQRKKLFNELHVYSILTNKWASIETLEESPPFSAHSATVHGNLMVVFGGINISLNPSNNIWCLNLDTYCWHKQDTSKLKPHPRYGQSQIPLDDKNLIILGGCTGPSVGIDDAWLLNMEGSCWTWSKINVIGNDFAPLRIWCHQACKIGDNIIILSKKKSALMSTSSSTSSSSSSSSSSNSVSNGKIMCHGALSLIDYSLQEQVIKKSLPIVDRDENVNGRRGRFLNADRIRNNNITQGNNSNLKINQSNGLAKRILNISTPLSGFNNNLSLNLKPKLTNKNISNRLGIFILNISNVLCEERSAIWLENNNFVNENFAPEERILYSLVLGKGELILFGGTRKFASISHGSIDFESSEVFNQVFFINPPLYTI